MTPARLDLLSALVDEFIVEHAADYQTGTLGQVHRWITEAQAREQIALAVEADDEPTVVAF